MKKKKSYLWKLFVILPEYPQIGQDGLHYLLGKSQIQIFKLRSSDLVHFLEAVTKLKILSEITPPLTE